MKKNIVLLTVFLLWITTWTQAQENKQDTKRASLSLEHGSHRLGKRTDKAMDNWREYGLGQFIHWGLYAIPGGFWQGKYYNGAAEWIRSWEGMPKEAYDRLYKQFNPKNFDAKAWAKQAKDMGARYMIITTKHHDGFCLWPSQYTNYTIANTLFKKDIIKALVEAYNEQGIDVYLYFSIIDWNHPGYRTKLNTENDHIQYVDFKKFTANQLKELLTRYPTVKGFWFDGTWDKAWVDQAAFCDDLEKELRSMKPGLIIGSRFRADEFGARHFDSNGDLMGDYEQGWERKIPQTIEDVHGNDWDCVMTVPNNQWGYHAEWKGHVKTANELIEMMSKCISLGGNFVLNFGPDAQGNIRKEETTLASQIGAWMKVNQDAIYGATHLDWTKQDWGYYTVNPKTGKIYMIVCNMPISGMLRVQTPKRIRLGKAYVLGHENEPLHQEAVELNSYYLYYKEHDLIDLKSPVVIVIDGIQNEKSDSVNFEKAKT